jgi:four helix bundle protein
MRNYNKLRVYAIADQLALDVFRVTASFPREERYGLAAQIRKSAVSVCSNIVEGASRSSQREYVRFLEVAYGSARELSYQISIADRLYFITDRSVADRCDHVVRQLSLLIRSLKRTSENAGRTPHTRTP